MSLHLMPCPDCVRHIRASEPSCPFCGREIPESLRSSAPPKAPVRRIGRTALFAFGVATSISVAACSDRGDPGPGGDVDSGGAIADSGGGGDEDGGGGEDSGTPGVDSGTPGTDSGSGDIDGGPVAMYGGPPPFDAGTDSGGAMNLYGGPPMRDDGGGAAPLYGAPADPDDPA
jgi:hypothetical protein